MCTLFHDGTSTEDLVSEPYEGSWVVGIPFRLVPPIRLRDRLIRACITSDSGHHCEIVVNENLFHHLNCLQVSQHIAMLAYFRAYISIWHAGTIFKTYPTEHIVFLSCMNFATLKASSISPDGPVATGFSMNRATSGKCFRICISISRPGWVVPRNIGGLPITNARGTSLRSIPLTKSSRFRKIRVFSYADRTKVSHLCCKTAAARSTAGSMRATTFKRGPNLLIASSN